MKPDVETVPIWELRRGEFFRLPNDPTLWRFCHMDGMYAFVINTETGEHANFIADVERTADEP
jgi:hypothetical protein